MRSVAIAFLGLLAGCTYLHRGEVDPFGTGEWRVVEIGRMAVVSADSVHTPWLRFDDTQRQVSGNGGCNRLAGPYKRSGTKLKFGPLIMTRMACVDGAITRQESAFASELAAVESYGISGDTLSLISGPTARVRLVKR